VSTSRAAALALAAAVLAAGCGDAAPTARPSVAAPVPPANPSVVASPEASDAPSSPSPEPPSAAPASADAAAAFVDAMADPSLTASIAVSGVRAAGATSERTTGSIDLGGDAYHVALGRAVRGRGTTTERIGAGAHRYLKRLGLWFAATDGPEDALVAALRSIRDGVTDLGVETRDGGALHHLSITPPPSLAAGLGLTDRSVSKVAPTLDVWVEADGTPVEASIAATFDQRIGKRTAHGTDRVDLAFSDVGGPVSVTPPTDVWATSSSPRYRYRMAHPTTWGTDLKSKGFIDAYFGSGRNAYVERFPAKRNSLGQLDAQLRKNPSRVTGFKAAKLVSDRAAHLGAMPARVAEVSGTYHGARYWWLLYIAVRTGNVYWFELRTPAKTSATDRALAASFARTFEAR
jgi:hypothetical protein